MNNTIAMERLILLIACIITLFYSWHSCAARTITIDEIHHHHSGFASTVEAGTCMVYCNELPKISLVHQEADGKETYTFILHNSLIAQDKARNKAEELKRSVTQPYAINIYNNTSKKNNEVVFSITCPKGKFCVQHKPWEQKNRNKKGLIFYIYNQDVLDMLKNKHKPMLRTAGLHKKIPRIFIDSGHGGSDTGAISVNDPTLYEKDICLHVSLDTARLLHEQGYDVLVSRMTDCDVPLDERTSRANSSGANLFVSVHANAALNGTAHGIETFCLTPTLFDQATEHEHHFDFHATTKTKKSRLLADTVHKSLCHEAALFSKDFGDRGVKYTVSHVLVGTTMPSILIELGFLSHKNEAALLASREYQYSLARGISRGIQAYCNLL